MKVIKGDYVKVYIMGKELQYFAFTAKEDVTYKTGQTFEMNGHSGIVRQTQVDEWYKLLVVA